MDQRLITRRILHPQWELTYRDYTNLPEDHPGQLKRLERRQLIQMIDRAKTYLVNERGFQPGQKVFLATTHWPEFPAWFFAVAELGGTFIVSCGTGIYNHRVIDYRLSIYGSVDHFIYSNDAEPSFSGVNDLFIDEKLVWNTKLPRDPVIAQQFWAEEQTVLLMSTSSGTTSRPKLVTHDHGFFWQLMRRNLTVFKLDPEDLCMHTKNLHHGSVLGVYYLPSMNRCRRHYWQASHTMSGWINSLNDSLARGLPIRRTLMFYEASLDELAREMIKPQHPLEIMYLTKVKPSSQQRLVEDLGIEMTSVFGCTETSGPLLLQRHSQGSRPQVNDFGRPLDDFYTLSLDRDSILTVTMPNGVEISPGDQFTIDQQGNWCFQKRTVGFRRQGTPIYLDLIAALLVNSPGMPQGWQLGREFDLCVDRDREMVIIRTDREIDLETVNDFLAEEIGSRVYEIGDQVVGARELFIHGIKLDCELIRDISRSQRQ